MKTKQYNYFVNLLLSNTSEAEQKVFEELIKASEQIFNKIEK